MNRPFHISLVHDRLLRGSVAMPCGLYQLHLATAEQLCRLHYSPKSVKWVKAKLKQLVDNGYIQADAIPTRHFNSPYYYTLTSRGMWYLAAQGLDITGSYRGSRETDKHYLFIAHTQELNDLIISALLLKRYNRTAWLESFIHERTLKGKPYKTREFTVVPDAFLRFRFLSGNTLAFLVEHDRGTEEQLHFRRRIRAYASLLQEEPMSVLFTTSAGMARFDQMREWTRKELDEVHAPTQIARLFFFTVFRPPLTANLWLEPCWHSLFTQPPFSLLSDS
jgi:Replication-relaxation